MTSAPDSIHYRPLRHYKYQLMSPYRHRTELRPPAEISTDDRWVALTIEGELIFRRGYAWDGPSGPAIDTRNFMRASLVHDGLYQLMRESLLDREYRKAADRLLYEICIADGMTRLRAFFVYWAVRVFSGAAIRPRPPRPVLRAP